MPEKEKKDTTNIWKIIAGVFIALFVLNTFFQISVTPRGAANSRPTSGTAASGASSTDLNAILAAEKEVLPPGGVKLPVAWDDMGKRMIDAGVIDAQKFESLSADRGGPTEEEKKILYGTNNGALTITADNSRFLLNMLWAFGLGNTSNVLTDGPMSDPQYGGAGKFASTGGWTLAKGNAMDHYGKHAFVTLTPEQAERVRTVAANIYRPCCGNSTLFPDCNHGMAMLGLLELMASQNISEADMYKAALAVNAYWFPDTYLTIAKVMRESNNTPWSKVDPKEVLGAAYSSASGYQQLRAKTAPAQSSGGGGGGCGV